MMSDVYSKKADKYEERGKDAKKYRDLAESFLSKSNFANDRVKDIKSGKLIAGRDFILQTDYNYNILWDSFETRVIYKDSKLNRYS